MKIFKFSLEPVYRQVIQMPQGSRILSIQKQRDLLCLWAICDSDILVNRVIIMYGTGHEFDAYGTFIQTVQLYDGNLVLHAFDHGETI